MPPPRPAAPSLLSMLSSTSLRPRRFHPRYQCLREPALQKLPPCRHFSNTPSKHVKSMQVIRPNIKVPAQKSPSAAQAEAMRDMEYPQDIGLVPQTFIWPRGSNLPSWIRQRKERQALLWAWVKAVFMDIYSQFYYKFFVHRTMRPRPKLNLFRPWHLADIAAEKHSEMYTALATNDMTTLREICADGILSSLRQRIASRAPNERLTWTRHAIVERPKVVSGRATIAPFNSPDGNRVGIRQVVVRIVTTQSLTMERYLTHEHAPLDFKRPYGKDSGKGKPGVTKERENARPVAGEEPVDVREGAQRIVTEYIVLQRRIWKGEEEDWSIWGFTEETSPERLMELKEEARQAAVLRRKNPGAVAAAGP